MPKKILSFGAFYHDDLDDGVSVTFSTFNDPKPGFTEFMYDNMMEVKDGMIKEIRSGDLTIAEVWDQLHAGIKAFNLKSFGTIHRPSGRNDYKIDILKTMNELVVIISDIWILTELGQIKNDNFNGMNFMYTR